MDEDKDVWLAVGGDSLCICVCVKVKVSERERALLETQRKANCRTQKLSHKEGRKERRKEGWWMESNRKREHLCCI